MRDNGDNTSRAHSEFPLAPERNEGQQSTGASNVRLSTASIWILLQVMYGIYNELLAAIDTQVKGQIWSHALTLFKEEVNLEDPESAPTVAALQPLALQQKWRCLKNKYTSLKSAHNITGIGGPSPDERFIFYDEIGQILKYDRSVHPPATIESESMNEAGPFIFQSEQQQRDDEQAAKDRARTNRVRFITRSRIQTHVLDPAKWYAQLAQSTSRSAEESTIPTSTGSGRNIRNNSR
jgi:hypothetical protein